MSRDLFWRGFLRGFLKGSVTAMLFITVCALLAGCVVTKQWPG